jgi:hypothetical protein
MGLGLAISQFERFDGVKCGWSVRFVPAIPKSQPAVSRIGQSTTGRPPAGFAPLAVSGSGSIFYFTVIAEALQNHLARENCWNLLLVSVC